MSGLKGRTGEMAKSKTINLKQVYQYSDQLIIMKFKQHTEFACHSVATPGRLNTGSGEHTTLRMSSNPGSPSIPRSW